MRRETRWMSSKKLWVVVAALVLALTPAAFAAGRMGAGGRGALIERAMDRLDLRAEQRRQVEAILAGHRAELRQELDAVMDAREAQFAAIHDRPFDEAKIRAAASVLGAAAADLAVTRGEIANEVRAVLSPEQQAELEEMLDDFRALAGSLGERSRRRWER